MINRWEPGHADTTRAHPIAEELIAMAEALLDQMPVW